MWIVTAHAIRGCERLVLVRFLQVSAFHIVAIHAKRRRSFGEMKVELDFADLSRFMRGMAGIAAHIQGGVPAAFRGNVFAGLVATQAQILLDRKSVV